MVAEALRVFTGPEAEVEANCDQDGNVVESEVRGAGCRGDDIVNDHQGGGLSSLYGGILRPAGLELPCEALVEPCARLIVGWFSGVWQTIQEVRQSNHPHV